MLALPLIPVLLYPGNYYLHLVFLLPLVVDELRVREPGDVPLAPAARGRVGDAAARCAPPSTARCWCCPTCRCTST